MNNCFYFGNSLNKGNIMSNKDGIMRFINEENGKTKCESHHLTIDKCIEYLKENKTKMSSEQFKALIRVTGGSFK